MVICPPVFFRGDGFKLPDPLLNLPEYFFHLITPVGYIPVGIDEGKWIRMKRRSFDYSGTISRR